eukprot:gene24429-10028_t
MVSNAVSGQGGMLGALQTAGEVFKQSTAVADKLTALAAGTGLMTTTLDKSIYDANKDPMFRHPAIADMFAAHCIAEDTERVLQPGLVSMSSSLRLMGRMMSSLVENQSSTTFQKLAESFNDGAALATALTGPASDAYFLTILETIVSSVRKMGAGDIIVKMGNGDIDVVRFFGTTVSSIKKLGAGDIIVVPAGWTRPPPEKKNGVVPPPPLGHPTQHAMLVLLHKTGSCTYSIGVVNTGEGVDYHPHVATSPTGEIQAALGVELRGVASERVENSPFWWALLRPLLYPNPKSGPASTYEQVLPAANSKLFSANVNERPSEHPPLIKCINTHTPLPPPADPRPRLAPQPPTPRPAPKHSSTQSEFRPVPRSNDPTTGACVLSAVRCCLRLAGMHPVQLNGTYLDLMSGLVSSFQKELESYGQLTSTESMLLKLISQGIARESVLMGGEPEQMNCIKMQLEVLAVQRMLLGVISQRSARESVLMGDEPKQIKYIKMQIEVLAVKSVLLGDEPQQMNYVKMQLEVLAVKVKAASPAASPPQLVIAGDCLATPAPDADAVSFPYFGRLRRDSGYDVNDLAVVQCDGVLRRGAFLVHVLRFSPIMLLMPAFRAVVLEAESPPKASVSTSHLLPDSANDAKSTRRHLQFVSFAFASLQPLVVRRTAKLAQLEAMDPTIPHMWIDDEDGGGQEELQELEEEEEEKEEEEGGEEWSDVVVMEEDEDLFEPEQRWSVTAPLSRSTST